VRNNFDYNLHREPKYENIIRMRLFQLWGIMVLRPITIRNTNRFLVFENTQDGSAECTLILRESGLEIYEANRSLQAAVQAFT
jgi:hypothetical protein